MEELTEAQMFLEAVRDICGEEGVQNIQSRKGGRSITVPTRVKDGHWLAACLGLEKANRVCGALAILNADGHYAEMPRIIVPLGMKSLVAQARSGAERLLLAGEGVRTVAERVGVHERTVWRLRARLVKDGKLAAQPKPEAVA